MQKKYLGNSPKLVELREQKKNNFKKKLIIACIFFVLITVGLFFLANWKEINIASIEIEGNKVVESEELENIIKKHIRGNYLWIIPKTNGLFYPRKAILKEIKSTYKRIEDIEIDTKDFKTLNVVLIENRGVYTWCGDEPFREEKDQTGKVLESNEICYFMDDKGYVFDKAPYFSGNVYLKFYGQIEKQDESPIGFYFSPKNFGNLINFKKSLENMNFEIHIFNIKENFDAEVYLKREKISKDSPKIIFKTNDDITQIAENLSSSISTDPLKSRLEKEYAYLLYIDLRYDNKVYYKFK